LTVGFGTHSEDNGVAAVVGGSGPIKTLVVKLEDATAIEVVGSITVASFKPQDAIIPRGSYILEASFQVTTAFTTSDSGAFNIGTNLGSGAFTDDDENGIDAAVAVTALDAIGAVVACDGALVGGVTSCGANSTSDVRIVFGSSTGVFTAGAGVLTVRYQEPQLSQGSAFAAVE